MLLVTAEEMRELDRATIESGYVSGLELMERAGSGVSEAVERRYGSLLGLRVLVLCGSGNNGGDGFVAARHLKARGAEVHVGLAGEPERVRGDARHQLEALEGAGLAATPAADEPALERLVRSRDQWDFALDALLGTGARGVPEGAIAAAVQALRDLDDAGTQVVAVDLPTGVNADTGEIARRAVRADLTVTFGAPKRGHYLYPGRAFVGELEVIDIGLLGPPDDTRTHRVELATASEMAELVPRRDPRAHKGSTGRVLIAGASPGLTGAVTLAARAATRSGAGYVQAAIPASLNEVLEVKLTEEMTVPCPETPSRTLALAAFDELLERAAQVDVWALGTGLSRDRESAELVRRIAVEARCPLVIDADGLNAFEGHGEALARIAAERVLTPHLGEMARLTRLSTRELEAGRIDCTRSWAQSWGSVVVLKGAPTVTASPDGRATVNPTGNPGMATAGMGDVLTGVIAALIGQGLGVYDAARLGAYLHGLAGDQAAARLGQHGLGASDAIEALPGAFLSLVRLRDETLEKRGAGRRA